MACWLRGLAGFLLLLPVAAEAQSPTPTTPAHPALAWSLGVAIPQGQLLRYRHVIPGQFVRDIWIPPQPVVVQALVAMPARPVAAQATAEPPAADAPPTQPVPTIDEYGVARYTFTVPGYYVRQTTVGYHYPERWVLDAGYNWRLLSAEFRLR